MTNPQALFIIWNAILNQSQDAKKTINNTLELMNRLGLLNNFSESYKLLDYDSIYSAMTHKPMLHRFYRKMTKDLHYSVIHIDRHFEGSPLNVFLCQNKQNVFNNLLGFSGVGPHKAEIAVFVFSHFLNYNNNTDVNYDYCFHSCPTIYETLGLEIEILDILAEREEEDK